MLGKAKMDVDDGLEDIRWIRGLAGERLPAASYALLPNLKKGILFASLTAPRPGRIQVDAVNGFVC